VSVGWPEVLDDIEDRLADVDRELSRGGPAVAPFVLPADLGPLPAALRPRAVRALQQTRARQAQAEAARDGIAEALRQSRTVDRGPAAYLDTWI
jgi:hypothetical protein